MAEIGPRRTGRAVGVLLLLQFVGLFVGFVLIAPGVTTEYLSVAAGTEDSLRIGALILLASFTVGLALAIAAFPVFRRYSPPVAFWFLAVSVVVLVLQMMDNAHFLSMLSLSKRFAESAEANADLYNVLAAQVRSTRVWGHYTTLLAIDAWLGTLYYCLFAYRLIPRFLSALALLSVALHAIGLPIAMFVGYPLSSNLAYALPVGYAVIGIWLVVKGFSENSLANCSSTGQ
jgi:hypothetical protein